MEQDEEQDRQTQLNTEIELIESSLLPDESLDRSPSGIEVKSTASKLILHVTTDKYPGDVGIEIKGPEVGRDEAEGWREFVEGKMNDWNKDEDYPLFQILTTHFLPLLAPSSPDRTPSPPPAATTSKEDNKPHHALLTSHHLLSSTKRKDLISLSSQLSLVGFSKTGHPGIYYAIGTKDDLGEWIREVKSWNWLALRVRMTAEPIDDKEEMGGRGSSDGARGGKGRGEWTELEKISEALEWLKARGREGLLLDIGMGGGGGSGDK